MRRFRIVLWLAVAVGCACPAYSQGVERWAVKTSLPEGAKKAIVVPLAELLALKDAEGVKHNDKRYDTERIPAQAGQKWAEGTLITTTGWLHLVGGESDGDFHVQISATAESGDSCLIVEVPSPDPKFTAAAALRPQVQAVRDLILNKMLAGKNPSVAGSVMQHPVYVTVTGALFFDDSHVGDQPRGKKGMKAATLWELHPVTAIAFAPKPK